MWLGVYLVGDDTPFAWFRIGGTPPVALLPELEIDAGPYRMADLSEPTRVLVAGIANRPESHLGMAELSREPASGD